MTARDDAASSPFLNLSQREVALLIMRHITEELERIEAQRNQEREG